MPELPEVETVKLGLWPRLKGYEIERVDLYRPSLRYEFEQGLATLLEKRTLVNLIRRGKYLAFGLDNGAHLIAHLGMSGSFRLENQPLMQPYHPQNHKEKHHHVRLWLKNHSEQVWLDYHDPRRFGFLIYRAPHTFETIPPWSNLGCEPLDDDFASEDLFKRLKSLKISMKSALMRQDIIAGLGNIYVLEALFLSGISPFMRASVLKKSEFLALTDNIQNLLKASIIKGGSSLKDHRAIDGSSGHFQEGFYVYGRSGKACLREKCTGIIERVIDKGRSSFFCTNCQSLGQNT
jgi:formamidopyrimidine-DNA glycosylase